MALILSDSEQETVDAESKGENRPYYYSAAQGMQVQISTDFEAFLILQGAANNAQTVNWLDLAQNLTIMDADRDSLVAAAYQNDYTDAENSQNELSPLIDYFNNFKEGYQLQGFEQVAECGLLLDDLQLPMNEIQTIINRLTHRMNFTNVGLQYLLDYGVTDAQQQEITSWYTPLTAY